MRAETTEAFFYDRSTTVKRRIAAFAINCGPFVAKMPCRTRAGTSHPHIASNRRGISAKSRPADRAYRLGSMRMSINGGAGRTLPLLFALPARCKASAPQRFARHRTALLCVRHRLRGGDRCSPAVAAAHRIPRPDRFGPPEAWQVQYQVPRIVPGVTDQQYAEQCRTVAPDHQEGRSMVVQCGDGDITEQFRCVRPSADMVNMRAAKSPTERTTL